jgi:DNA (cytosine-5)-methyltransferase 1
MRLDRLDTAPIFNDVTKLRISDLPDKIEIIMAGFPCQDISIAGKTEGIVYGKKSSRFNDIMKLVELLPSVKYIFLENVANINRHGLKHVLQSLNQAGFYYAHGMFQANEVGAPHQRKRWFLVGARADVHVLRQCKPPRRIWGTKEPGRLVPFDKNNHKQLLGRYPMLGNSVVPQCTAHAWNILVRLLNGNKLDCTSPDAITGYVAVNRPNEELCMVKRNVTLNYLKTPIRLPLGTKNLWSTPTATFWHQYRNISKRSYRTIGNQIFYEAGTQNVYNEGKKVPNENLSKYFDINAWFIEWLMGYPRNWTLTVSDRGGP